MDFSKTENKEALEDIKNILQYANKGFYFFTTKTASAQNEVIKNLKSEHAVIFDYSKNIKPYSYYDLVELIENNPGITKFIILNFHLALQEINDIYNLNLSRDVLAGHSKLWIFGMTQDIDDKLAKTAFDFYSYVMMKVRFKEENEEIHDKELAYLLIKAYENSIIDKDEKSPEFIIKTYNNMANLYYNLSFTVKKIKKPINPHIIRLFG
jgi:hypothetical protein